MIGDWAYSAYHMKNIRITPYDFFVHCHDAATCEQYLPQNAKPCSGRDLIPLPITHEILKKNGFGYIEKTVFAYDTLLFHYYPGEEHICENMDFHIGTNGQTYWLNVNGNTIRRLKYVHELQHALRLCGIEKEIVL